MVSVSVTCLEDHKACYYWKGWTPLLTCPVTRSNVDSDLPPFSQFPILNISFTHSRSSASTTLLLLKASSVVHHLKYDV